jgi:hypothetical protein
MENTVRSDERGLAQKADQGGLSQEKGMPRALRSSPLTTVQNVGIEIARIYRKTKRGEISTPDGYRLVQMLAVLKSCLESATLEQRLSELEAAVAQGEHQHFRPRMVS